MPFAWNANATVIFIEQPLLTGYSFSDDPADQYTDDDLNADRMVLFLIRWLERFPSFLNNDLYLASESYGTRCALT